MSNMKDMTSYFVGELEYKTNGAMLLVNRAARIHTGKAAQCEALSDSVLEIWAGKAPIVTLSAQFLKDVLGHLSEGGDAVSLFVEDPDKPVLFVCGKERYAILMPLQPSQSFSAPRAAQPGRKSEPIESQS